MRIVFTGGGTGGHFYPIIAIAEAIQDLVREEYLVAPQLYFIAPDPFDSRALFENSITYLKSPAGKVRRYPSIRNVTDLFLTAIGFVWSFLQLLRLYPDVVVSKGGYTSVPTVLAARVLRIPVIIHESDAKPGRANLMASRFAARIATSFESAAKYFPEKVRGKVARTGTPVRKRLLLPTPEDAAALLQLDTKVPTVLVLGGSLGSQRINETILEALPDLVTFANVIHQTGKNNFDSTKDIAGIALEGNTHAARYHPYAYLSTEALHQAAGVASLIISRAGSGTIAEIAMWQLPAIIIPIPEEVSHDQRTNAYAYAHTGAAVVLEEHNLSPHILVSEVRRILQDTNVAATMAQAGAAYADPDAGKLIAKAALDIALSHESGK